MTALLTLGWFAYRSAGQLSVGAYPGWRIGLHFAGICARHGGARPMARELARRSAFLLILALVALPLADGRAPAAEQGTLEIVTKSGVRTFAVELAVTEEERAKG